MSDRLEVMLVEVVGDFLAEHGALHIGGAEVDAGPQSGIDYLLERVRKAVEAPHGYRTCLNDLLRRALPL
jgi:hypothetical protein